MKERAELLSMFAQHHSTAVLPAGVEAAARSGDATEHATASRATRPPFKCHFYMPGTYCGGVVACVDRMLHMDPTDGSFTVAPSSQAP